MAMPKSISNQLSPVNNDDKANKAIIIMIFTNSHTKNPLIAAPGSLDRVERAKPLANNKEGTNTTNTP